MKANTVAVRMSRDATVSRCHHRLDRHRESGNCGMPADYIYTAAIRFMADTLKDQKQEN